MEEPKFWLSDEDYKNIFSKVPRVCIDLLIKDSSGRILLSLRNIEPYKGLWHLPGGMIYKGESMEDAAARIALKETGLIVKFEKVLKVGELLEENRIDYTQHVILLITEVTVIEGELKKDFQSSELSFFDSAPDNTIPVYKQVFI
ncbi:MAG: NUDIX domain-containing protein [Candidatus Taylorbacteria bacterium]|nr:NUDIX domain-containing protein [Candidatus Taylorbacteria bacterium]